MEAKLEISTLTREKDENESCAKVLRVVWEGLKDLRAQKLVDGIQLNLGTSCLATC
jgi:hypothetical protein